jgi:cholinesterase
MILHGQSAGGASVDYYSYAWTEDPIISGFIPQSGSAAIRSAAVPGDPTVAAINQWSTLSGSLGCGAISAEEVSKSLACMRSKPLSQVMDATAPPKTGKSMGSWGPKIDGKTVFADLAERGNKGKFIHAVSPFFSGFKSIITNQIQPIFVGNTNNEGANSGSKVGSAAALRSNCGPRRAAQLRKDAGVPAWRYIYAGEFENQKKGPCSLNSEGAWYVISYFKFIAIDKFKAIPLRFPWFSEQTF